MDSRMYYAAEQELQRLLKVIDLKCVFNADLVHSAATASLMSKVVCLIFLWVLMLP